MQYRVVSGEPVPMYQIPSMKRLDRADHIWKKQRGGFFKCVLCGGLTEKPPDYPTPSNFMPTRFEKLTNDDRNQVPFRD